MSSTGSIYGRLPRVEPFLEGAGSSLCTWYNNLAFQTEIPEHEIPDFTIPPTVALRLIDDDLSLDGEPRLNLATFVTTHCEQEAEELMMKASKKNAIDLDQYPQVWKIQQRCVNMIANLFHAPLMPGEGAVGTACIGSSEAIMLATLGMKWRWKERQKAKGKSTANPNMVFGANVQVCWHKACKYFEVEAREAPISTDCLVLTAERAKALIDENTIGVCPILGSTFNGEYEDVKSIHDMVQELNKANGWDIPIHVDAASGGFVAPFVQRDLVWDFALPGVKSINVSGHKYGLVYAGLGWILFREKADLHPDLIFSVDYLGGEQASFTLNFSKSSGTIIVQYFNFLRLGKQGFTQVLNNCMSNAEHIRSELIEMGRFDICDKGHLPVVAFSLNNHQKFTLFELADKLRNRGWIVPAYNCPKGADNMVIMRIVVKENLARNLCDMLVEDIKLAVKWVDENPTRLAHMKDQLTSFRHTIEKSVKEGDLQEVEELSDEMMKMFSTTGPVVLHSTHDPKHRILGDKTHGVC
eukprot:29275_1